jgi:hypothetical protein
MVLMNDGLPRRFERRETYLRALYMRTAWSLHYRYIVAALTSLAAESTRVARNVKDTAGFAVATAVASGNSVAAVAEGQGQCQQNDSRPDSYISTYGLVKGAGMGEGM